MKCKKIICRIMWFIVVVAVTILTYMYYFGEFL